MSTSTTASRHRAGWFTIDIFFGKFVTTPAVRFASVDGRHGGTSHSVLASRNGLNVDRVDAMSPTTKMVSLKKFRDSFYENAKYYSMRVSLFSRVVHSCVTRRRHAPNPQPTWDAFIPHRDVDCDSTENRFEYVAVNEKPTVFAGTQRGLTARPFSHVNGSRICGVSSVRIVLHSLFSLKLDRLCMATSGVTSRVAFSF